MKYSIVDLGRPHRKPARIWVSVHGQINCATKAYQWAVGMPIDSLRKWWIANDRELRWESNEIWPPGYFLKHQVPTLRRILEDFFGIDKRARPERPSVIYFGPFRTIKMSRSRSRRTWKVLVKELFRERTPAQIDTIVSNCRYTNHHYYLNKGRP